MTSRAMVGPTPEQRSGHNIRLDLPLLLPEVKDVSDACVERLVRLLELRAGV